MAGRFLSVVFLLAALSSNVFGIKQELTLRLKGGNSLKFDQNTPDMTDYAALLPKVEQFCWTGTWYTFDGVNYNNASFIVGNGLKQEPVCITYSDSKVHSVRHLANQDTDIDQISLYEGTYFEGLATEVTQRALTGISHKVESVAASGRTDWMLFDGQFLDGNSYCYPVPYPKEGYYLNYHVSLTTLPISTIGSVFRGCDLPEIQAYREAHFLV